MKLPNMPKVLAATYNPISKTKMFSVMVDFPTVLLAELRTHRIITQGSSEFVKTAESINKFRYKEIPINFSRVKLSEDMTLVHHSTSSLIEVITTQNVENREVKEKAFFSYYQFEILTGIKLGDDFVEYEHSEIVDLSLSANSARAIPHKKYVERVLENPFIPVWTEQQKGMSGKGLSEEKVKKANQLWLDNLKEKEFKEFLFWSNEDGDLCTIDCDEQPNKKDYDLNDKEELEEYGDELEEYNSRVDQYQKLGGESVEYELKTLKSNYDELIAAGVHKQNANRLLAPFAYTTCILSGTEWENFFELRCPKYTFQTSWAPHVYRSKKEAMESHQPLAKGDYCSDHTYRCHDFTEEDWQAVNQSGAQPEFQIIAELIYDLYREAKFEENEYHVPFEEDIHNAYGEDIRKKIGVIHFAGSAEQAREAYNRRVMDYVMLVSASLCAKLSYDTQDKEDTLDKHLERAQLLKTHKHAEPFSHQAVPMLAGEYEHGFYKSTIKLVKNAAFGKERTIVKELGWCYNNRGFISQRYLIENLQ